MTYRVVVTRENRAWLAEVPELPGTRTWAKNLPKLEAAIREAIALALDLPEGREAEAGLDLEFDYHIGDQVLDEQAARLRKDRERLRAEQERLTARSDKLVRELAGKELPVRDVGKLAGVSPQRVSQITGRRLGGSGLLRSVTVVKTSAKRTRVVSGDRGGKTVHRQGRRSG